MPQHMAGWTNTGRLTFSARGGRTAALLLLVLLVAPLALRAQAGEADLIITANTGNLFPVAAFNPPVDDADIRLEMELKRLRQAHPDATLVDAGRSISLCSEEETGYDLKSAEFFQQMDYSVVNLGARDAVLSMSRFVGYQQAPGEYLAPLITNFESSNPRPLGLPAARRVETPGLPITFVSMGESASAAAIAGKWDLMERDDLSASMEAIREAVANGDVVVVFADLLDKERNDVLALTPPPDVLVDLRRSVEELVTRSGDTWMIPAPAGGEVYSVVLKRGADGTLDAPRVEVSRYLTPGEYAGLIEMPIPSIGFPIPNLDSVLQEYFALTADSTRIDKVDATALSDLTALEEPSVYHLVLDGKPHRLYRVFFHPMNPAMPEFTLPGWPRFDYLVMLDDKSNLVRTYSRLTFPVGTLPTTLAEALNKLPGVPPDQWQPDPRLAAGIEEFWYAATDAIRKTMELDQKLYGEGGTYTKSK